MRTSAQKDRQLLLGALEDLCGQWTHHVNMSKFEHVGAALVRLGFSGSGKVAMFVVFNLSTKS